MKKILISIISITLLLLFISDSKGSVSASERTTDFLMKTGLETPLQAGAAVHYKVKTIIPPKQMVTVISEFQNRNKELWLNVKFGEQVGWIKKQGLSPIDINNQYFTSSSANAAIRRGALSTYDQVSTLQRGQIVKIIDKHISSNGDRWVRLDSGQSMGWVQLSDLELFHFSKDYLQESLLVTEAVKVRRGASYSEKVSFTIPEDSQVNIQSFIVINSEKWYRIQDGNRSGWISSKEVSGQPYHSNSFYVKDPTAIVRSGASVGYKVLANLTIGESVDKASEFVNAQNEIWYKITLGNGKEGWVLSSSLTKEKIKVAYLTIDDGPTIYTGQLLDVLKKYNAKATFFMLNNRMILHQGDVRRMIVEGHAVGSHSVTHDVNKIYASANSVVSEMVTTRNTIKKITGVNSNLMRVPYGSIPYMKSSYRDAVKKQGLIMWDWNIDSLDWKYKGSKYVDHTMSQIYKQEEKGNTPYILIHDLKSTIDHLPKLLSTLTKEGYILAPLSENMKPHQFSLTKK
ncbi:polysaccharide deacetylase family protein [Cytobacillus sp. FJAT-54145]|uniref:Polysaccharide deacetylase family protein n=1 Tax=Cytobacillus spartinae TaxID=3299023 RepID=A0ABW6KG02_9BACI